ncbi:phosphate ABC transporter ATP-binding protein [Salinarchaeum sp. IM2453]|uniref:amino acid ABC transporter ATP-binding protein n=1 Tax=Salinarchaeum sp. IM2453 TaxID=2862870 RepID=UPI001C8302A4|nr:phosphate ABC transporter ATP-binding protein [Salinarchaeum sp. IM2453]QZA88418.1 phosphate ABC transporter ATP-binding protein [Salinarchaeum sp. IM2453]
MIQQQQRQNNKRTIADGLGVENVRCGFGDSDVLNDVTLTIEPGKTVAVIGPSGTGKTTLLRLLACFHRPDTGSVKIDNTNVWELSKRERLRVRRRIGMVFQEPNLFDTTVRRNVNYGRHIRQSWRDRLRRWVSRMTGEKTSHEVTEALNIVGLANAETRSAESLSGGEAQRVAFARALAYDPDFLLLDEPTSDLDPRNTAVIEDAINTARTRGMGVAIATHDMNQAKRIADRVAVMLEGQLIETGPTERVFTNPNDPRARKFIDGELVY